MEIGKLLRFYSATAEGASSSASESSYEIDDEYLPSCCRNGKPHSHPV